MNITDIDLKSLEVLEALVIEKNVTRTAEKVGLSQPAVSHSLAKLRRLFEDPLLIRTRTGMVPTSRALALLEPIRQVREVLQKVIAPAEAFDPQKTENRFKIATTDYAEWLLMPSLCQLLSEKAPKAKLEIDPMRERIPLRQLEKGEIDLAIGYFTETPESLYQQELFTEDFVCVVHKDSGLVGKKLSLKKFVSMRHMLVAPWGGMASLVDAILSKQSLQRTVHVSTTRFLVAPMVVAQTDLIVTLPRRVATSFAEYLPLSVVELPVELPTFSFKQLWHNRTHHEPAQKWLRSQIVNLESD